TRCLRIAWQVLAVVLLTGVLFSAGGGTAAGVEDVFPSICGEKEYYREFYPGQKPDLEIQGLQTRLRELGYYAGKAHGVLDAVTLKALKWFKRDQGLPAKEVVDEETWRRLAETYETAAANPGGEELPRGEVKLVVEVAARKLTVLSDGEPFCSFPVAVGKKNTPTPIGEFRITRKALDWGGGFGSRWLGLSVPWGIYGIHGTNKPWLVGQAVSHGCIRMRNRDVERLYRMVYPGVEVDLKGNLPRRQKPPTLRRGQASQEVVALQFLLRQAKLYPGRADGRFGEETEAAVRMLEEQNQLAVDGIADAEVWKLLYAAEKPAGDRASGDGGPQQDKTF
ncbi:MAG: peptidoglycan-binding protein, partial [Syntrophomonadaceae bacterium]|nr:peptidoglycan-binding protein [Syntrophomonadaceae bacterium]